MYMYMCVVCSLCVQYMYGWNDAVMWMARKMTAAVVDGLNDDDCD